MKSNKLLKNTHPELFKEWDFEKNTEHPWETISTSSGHKVWWKCENGHSWDAAVYSRTSKTAPCGCRYCCHNAPPTTKRNFATVYPELLIEWDYDKNTIDPTEVSPKSCKPVWWKCKYGHSWITRVAHRANGHKCQRCNNKSSRLQVYIYCEVKHFFVEAEYCKKLNGIECDIYLPNENIAVELDSTRWHKGKEDKDSQKVIRLRELGTEIISIRENNMPTVNHLTIGYINGCEPIDITTDLMALLGHILNRQDLIDYSLNKTPVNETEYFNELSNYPMALENSLADTNPKLAKEWDYENNGRLKPTDVTAMSHHKVWWKCDNGHKPWKAIISNRHQFNQKCPHCQNHSSLSYSVNKSREPFYPKRIRIRGKAKERLEAQCPRLPLE